MIHKEKLGSLYVDMEEKDPGSIYHGGLVTIGPSVPGKEITWVVADGLLIANRTVLCGINWDTLNRAGLVFGTKIELDGHQYVVRSLSVGTKKGVPNEWDRALNAVVTYQNIWHWKDSYFWGQESPESDDTHISRVVRGRISARHFASARPDSKELSFYGFRPVLAPVTEALGESHVGKEVIVWAGQSIIQGKLEDLTDYDLLFSGWTAGSEFGKDSHLVSKDGLLVIERQTIRSIQTERKNSPA